MKNWKISLAAVLGLLLITSAAFAEGALDKVRYSKHEGSKKAQQQLNEEMLNLLKTKQFKKLEDYYVGLIPSCKKFKDGVTKDDIPTRCSSSATRNDNPDDYSVSVTVYNDEAHTSVQGTVDLNVVSTSAALYWALTKYYISLYGQDPSVLNAKNYADFYKRFDNWGFKYVVSDIMIRDWQGGRRLDEFIPNNPGKKNLGGLLYNCVNTAKILGEGDPKHECIYLPSFSVQNIRETYPRILNQIYGRAKALNNMSPFYSIKTYWFNMLLRGGANVGFWNRDDYYSHNAVINILYAFGNSEFDAWKIYAISPVTNEQKQWVKKMVENCNKAKKKYTELQCGILKDNAIKYGYLAKSQQEVKADIKKALNSNSKHPRADANGHIGPMK